MRLFVLEQKLKCLKIGFTPTMGALHDGHIRLVKTSLENNDITIASIFVNPSQFNSPVDFNNYPNTIEEDKEKLKALKCDVLFLPSAKEMYPNEDNVAFSFGKMGTVMEGRYREGHFSGVGMIVSKFFNIVQPNTAYFGAKDLQQIAVIKKLVRDLNFNIDIVGVATVREKSGLAMSSRNLRLSEKEKEIAANIYESLNLAKELVLNGNKLSAVKEEINIFFTNHKAIEVEYLEIVDSNTLLELKNINKVQEISICIAAHVGAVRLIDNISFTRKTRAS